METMTFRWISRIVPKRSFTSTHWTTATTPTSPSCISTLMWVVLGLEVDMTPTTSVNRYAQLINTTPYNLKSIAIDDQVEIVHRDVNAQYITNGYYVLGLQHLDGGTGKQPGLVFTRTGGQKIGAIEPYVNSSYNNC